MSDISRISLAFIKRSYKVPLNQEVCWSYDEGYDLTLTLIFLLDELSEEVLQLTVEMENL